MSATTKQVYLNSPSFARKSIEKLGKKLATFTQKNHDFQSFEQTKAYQSINLAQIQANFNAESKANKNAFHEHIPKLSKRLFGGTRLNEFSGLAGNFVSQSTLEKVSDTTFLQIGKLAQSWAEADLTRDSRFHLQSSNANIDLSERHALAQAIAYQNRALVAMGSVSNLAGLVGILADTVWLLLVALRSIFQIASIYDKPLTGKAGILIAYEILSKANLHKLQEKQTLLAGIGVMEAVVDKSMHHAMEKSDTTTVEKHAIAQDTPEPTPEDLTFHPFKPFNAFKSDLQNGEYKKLTKFADDSETEQTSMLATAMGYITGLEKLARRLNVNLHAINLGKLNKVLPITAVGIGASYNNVIIDEILTIAMATFAPEPKIAKLEQAATVE